MRAVRKPKIRPDWDKLREFVKDMDPKTFYEKITRRLIKHKFYRIIK